MILVFQHEYFRYGLPNNDIALIEVSERITFDNSTKAVCLKDDDEDITGWKNCWGTGWGMREGKKCSLFPAVSNDSATVVGDDF